MGFCFPALALNFFVLEEIVIEKFNLLGNSRILDSYIGGNHVPFPAPSASNPASTFT